MGYTVKQLANIAGVSVRTLHFYDEVGLLVPESRGANNYRHYGDDALLALQQIMFFRELGFSLYEIKQITTQPDFDVGRALESHKQLLKKKAERLNTLIDTVEKTIGKLKGETNMSIKDYYQGFSEEEIEKYRREVKDRWGEKTLVDSEKRVTSMGKEKFKEIQQQGGDIFQALSDNMPRGYDSPEVQKLVADWRRWLENFHQYSDEAASGLGRAYSEDERFARFFEKYHKDLPKFITKAIEYYSERRKLA